MDGSEKDKTTAYEIEAFTLLSVALLITAIRTYSRLRIVGIKRFEADDYLVLVGAVFHALETGCAYGSAVIARGLANNSMTDEQRATLDPNSEEYRLRVLGSKLQIVGYSLYSVLLWSLKAAMCNFYRRLASRLWKYSRRIYVGFAFIGLSWLVVILNLFLACRPLSHMWQINPNPGIYCQPAVSPAILGTFLSFNIATDLYLMLIPIPMVFEGHMKTKIKIGLCFLFCCALFIIAAASIRVALILENPVESALLSASWAVRETFVSVIVTNLPVLLPLLKQCLGQLSSTMSSHFSSNQRRSERTTEMPLDAYRASLGAASLGETISRRRTRGASTLYPITNIMGNSTEEDVGTSQLWDSSHPQDLTTLCLSALLGGHPLVCTAGFRYAEQFIWEPPYREQHPHAPSSSSATK